MYDNINYPPGADGPDAPWNAISPSDKDIAEAEQELIDLEIVDFISQPSLEKVGPFSLNDLVRMLFNRQSNAHEHVFAALEICERFLNQPGMDDRVNSLAHEKMRAREQE